jgi:hypothetical protein
VAAAAAADGVAGKASRGNDELYLTIVG